MRNNYFFEAKNIHFIGIGGMGVSALANLALAWGKKVSGSDLTYSDQIASLEEKGAKFFLGHLGKNIKENTDLVIYSSAVPEDNAERKRAKEKNIPQASYFQVLGEISRKWPTIAIAGTHGKSTTTALIGLLLEKAGLNPLVILGAKVRSWGSNFFCAQNPSYFVVEACEWNANFLSIFPDYLVLTNLEEEHLDYYQDIFHLRKTFEAFIGQIKKGGFLIFNSDDKNLSALNLPKKRISYGFNQADLIAKNIISESGKQQFDLVYQRKIIRRLQFRGFGVFNVYNALAATCLGLALGINIETVRKVFENFQGLSRRFEILGKLKGKDVIVVSDYAHHPTALCLTIQAARRSFPKRRIFLVYQPHQRNRTKKLFEKFLNSFWEADFVILSEVYSVAGREKKENVSSMDLVQAIKNASKFGRTPLKNILFAKDLKETYKLIQKNILPGDLLLIVGAGNICKIADQLDLEEMKEYN